MKMISDRSCRLFLFSIFCLLSMTALTGYPSSTTRFGIIFTNGFSGAMDIYRIPDSTKAKVEQLTFTPTTGEYSLLVSKYGDRIIFETEFYIGSENSPADLEIEVPRHIYLLDTASKKLVDITKILEDKYAQTGRNFFMDWSPDEKRFVVLDYGGGGYEIKSYLEFVDFDGKNRKDVLVRTTGEIPALLNSVKWSPDGRKFALTQGVIGTDQQWANPGSAILIYDIKSGTITQITEYKDNCFPIKWSPTSRQIATNCAYVPPYGAEGGSGPQTVRIFDVENPGQPYEHVGFSPCFNPSWSPDGKQIVFVCSKGTGRPGLFIVNSDGNGIHEVKLGNLGKIVVLKQPVWSPDGTQIIYVAGRDYGHTKIYSVNLDGSNNHALTGEEKIYNIYAIYPLP